MLWEKSCDLAKFERSCISRRKMTDIINIAIEYDLDDVVLVGDSYRLHFEKSNPNTRSSVVALY